MLPEDVGFKVGANSRIKYLVLQVHYINVETIDKGLLKNIVFYSFSNYFLWKCKVQPIKFDL